MSTNCLEYTGERMVPELTDSQTFWEHIYRYRFALPYVKNKRVLDIASGEGYGTSAIQMAGAKNVVGVDISPETCIFAQNKYSVDTRVGSAERIPLPDNSFDIVVSFETIEHLEKPSSFLGEAQRVLSGDGALIISTPNKDIFDKRGSNEYHKNEFSRSEFIRIIRNYFPNIRLFGQMPIVDNIFRRNAFCSQKIPASDLRGLWRIEKFRKKILKNIYRTPAEKREHANYTVLEHDNMFSTLLNPYLIRPVKSSQDNFTFFIVVASK